MDKIILKGMGFHACHGVLAWEQENPQEFIVDLEISRDLWPAGSSDNLAATVDYSQVYRLTGEIMEGPVNNLIEALAEKIATMVLANFPVTGVMVRVCKPQVKLGGKLDYAAVEIYRGNQP